MESRQITYLVHFAVVLVALRICCVNSTKAYYFENEKFLTWIKAFDFCKNMNMNLLTIRNKEEFDYLKSLIEQRYKRFLPWWLDAYKLEGVWKWISTGDNIKLYFWQTGEPNDNGGDERCIHTAHEGELFSWNDNDCDRELPFICEAEEKK